MCGIAGVFDRHFLPPHFFSEFKNGLDYMGHRGPDGRGMYIDDQAVLGQTRLSIIDLAGGSQPIPNEDRTLWLVCNGEIFNYIELQQELKQQGHHFTTGTDVEVILHLYENYGADLFEYLNGQFAFAIWDKPRRTLFMGRDHVGICPLHFSVQNDRIYFASEAKLFSAFSDLETKLDIRNLMQTLTFWSPLPGNTLFQGVNEVKPGHYLVFDRNGMTEKPYWRLDYPDADHPPLRGEARAREQVTDLLRDSVRIRLRADVPVGAYLSGGLDSSITTALVKTDNTNRLRTFSIAFEEKPFDESAYQQMVSQHLGTDHSSMVVSNRLICDNLKQVIWHAEKPVLRTSPAPLFLLSQHVRESGFKVVLTGEGADEFFSGYNIYKETKVRWFNSRFPNSKYRSRLYEKIYPYIATNPRTINYWTGFFQNGVQNTDDPFYSHRLRWNNKAYLAGFLAPDIIAGHSAYDPVSDLKGRMNGSITGLDPLLRAHYLEAHIFLSGYLLSSQGDRMIMGHSVEGRYPFLDKRLIKFANHLDPRLKMRVLNEKWILKQAFGHLLPEAVIKRDKQPYRAPVKNTLLANPGLIEQWLDETRIRQSGLFDPAKVLLLKKRLLQTDKEIPAREEMALVAIITTEMWLENFIYDVRNLDSETTCHVFDYRSEIKNQKG